MEFAEHRPYQPGDDLRHLDRHAYARFREPYVKRFASERGLAVRILVDRSASMTVGAPAKDSVAMALAEGIACAALAGGDELGLGVFGNGARIDWHPPITGIGRLRDVIGWLRGTTAGGTADLTAVAMEGAKRLPSAGLLVVLTDWWTDDAVTAVRAFARTEMELVAVHVTAHEDEDPFVGASGDQRFQDAETGEVMDVAATAAMRDGYHENFVRWRSDLRRTVEGVRGRYLPVANRERLSTVLLQDWRTARFIA